MRQLVYMFTHQCLIFKVVFFLACHSRSQHFNALQTMNSLVDLESWERARAHDNVIFIVKGGEGGRARNFLIWPW